VEEYLRRNQRDVDSAGNEEARLSFQEKRRLSNKKKTILEKLQQLNNEEETLSKDVESAQLKMGLYATDYEKLQQLQRKVEQTEGRLLEIIEEREILENELQELSMMLEEQSQY